MTGAEFSQAFHAEAVAPLLERRFPGLRYAAARLGSGSDVLGFDDEISRDHDWGARLTLLVDEPDRDAVVEVDAMLEAELPQEFRGRPVRFGTTWHPAETHKVQATTVMDFAASRLGADPRNGLSTLEWLCLTGHSVLETVGGPVFHDDTADLAKLRDLLEWYPSDVEQYVTACAWQRVAQGLPLAGRTAGTGQELQSRVLYAGLVNDLMHLAFLRERAWMPYPKWREARFTALKVAPALREHLNSALAADDWRLREKGVIGAAEILGGQAVPFFDRPYRTVNVPEGGLGLPLVGSIEQWVHSSDILARPELRPAVIAAYRQWLTAPAAEAAG
jgi:hypothetical protein